MYPQVSVLLLTFPDPDGNMQQLEQMIKSQQDFNAAECNLSLCKGLQFADNQANVQQFTAGQVVPITAQIKAPHTGIANVSVVNTQTNTVIGEPMIEWAVYASNSAPIPANNTQFSVTMPDVGTQCGTAGNCVVQWWWDSRSADQTYMSCVDFTM